MSGQLSRRLGAVLAIAAIWLGLVVLPASAATVTVRYVDDNPNATSCHGTHFHSIQAAIDASNDSDWVLVCPGTYSELLTLDVPRLRVESTQFRKAHLVAPGIGGEGALVAILANRVKLRGFDIQMPAGAATAAAAAPNLDVTVCQEFEAAVLVLGDGDEVWGNNIDATGDNTLSGSCGYLIGILVEGPIAASANPTGSPLPTTNLLTSIKRNYVRDFKLGGIIVEFSAGPVRINHNAIRYVHADDPATCVPINTVNPSIQDFPCAPVSGITAPAQLNGLFGNSVGIGVVESLVGITFNTVYSTFDFSGGPFGPEIPLEFGISLLGGLTGSLISENVVTQVFMGISTDQTDIPLAVPSGPTPASDVRITLNRANEGLFGFDIESDNTYVYNNRARFNILGLGTTAGANILFERNDARYNLDFDCYDFSNDSGTGTLGTDNTWTENFGNFNAPADLCTNTGGPF